MRTNLVLLLATMAVSCGGEEPAALAESVHLVDRVGAVRVEGRDVVPPPPAPATQWTFDADAGTERAWEAGPGVEELVLGDGSLRGRATDDFPLLHVERELDLKSPDTLQAVEVRLKVSAGSNLWFGASIQENLDLEAHREWWRVQVPISTPLVPGPEFRTYRFDLPVVLGSRTFRHVLLRPTDVAGATFEIDSVRLVWRREYLAELPSGATRQGFGDVWRETIVARSPEQLAFELTVSPNARFEAALATMLPVPVTFHVVATRIEGSQAAIRFSRTVSLPGQWEDIVVDLTALGEQPIRLTLTVEADQPGEIGLWGSPVVRAPAPPARDAVRPQGVILVMVDTLRKDHLGLYGYARETAPNLSRMAEEGVTFRDCIAQGSWTKASATSLLTSLYPTTHGVADFGERLPATATTLAEVFREAGYATLSMSSVLFTGRFSNLHQGFEVVHEANSVRAAKPSHTSLPYVRQLIPWLDEHKDVPFFVFLHLFDPHDPYEPPPPYDVRFAAGAAREEHARRLEAVRPHIVDPMLRRLGMSTTEELVAAGVEPRAYVEHLENWYDGSIAALDVELQRLLEALVNLELDDRTLVVFTSDHGEEFLDHGRMFHGQGVHAELIEVPLVLRWPGGIPANVSVDEVVQGIDVMPTILEIAGLPVPTEAQGQSLVPLWSSDGATWNARPAFAVKSPNTTAGPPPRDAETIALVTARWKLLRHVTGGAPGHPVLELYDRKRDRHERVEVGAENPEVLLRLAAELEAWRERTTAARLLPAEAAELGAEELQHLRALGYIE